MLKHWDSFDGYATVDLPVVFDQVSGGPSIVASAGRNGTASFRFTNGNPPGRVRKNLVGTPQTVGLACSLRLSGTTNTTPFFFFGDGGAYQFCFGLNAASLKFEVRRGQMGTVIATGTKTVQASTTYHIELKVKIDPTTGTVQLKINGVDDINVTNVNTRQTANSQATEFYLGSDLDRGGGVTADIDDLIVWDTVAGAVAWDPVDFVGDCAVQAVLPDADGASSAWTPNATTVHFSRVNEAAQDGDTTYLSSATPGDRDTWSHGNLRAATGVVLGVAQVLVARKDDAGARSIVSVVRHAGVNNDNATVHALGTSYTYERDNLVTNPGTAAAFTIADVNGDEFGVKENA